MQYCRVLFVSLALILSVDLMGCRQSKSVAAQTKDAVVIATRTGNSDSMLLGAEQVIRRFFDLETNQKYQDIYDLFSTKRVKYYRRFHVNNRIQYEALRRDSEAVWAGFIVDNQKQDGTGAVNFTGHATVEETGVIEKVSFKARLVNENGEWKIDKWEY